MKGLKFAVPLLGALCCAPAATAVINISYSSTVQAAADQSQMRLLTLQGSGQESGYALRDATTHTDILGGDALSNSRTLRVAQLLNNGITADNFGLMLAVREPTGNPQINLTEFRVVFYDRHDTAIMEARFRANGDPLSLTPVLPFPGRSGHMFSFNMTEAQLDTLFADRKNRIGIFVPGSRAIENSQGQGERFFITGGALPSPGSAALIGLAAIVGLGRRRRA
jgi:hypothetical protein